MNVLFLCVANSARSQMAEGLARSILGERVCVESAGSVPAENVNACAVEVLKEIGIDISQHKTKSIADLPKGFVTQLDLLVTLCKEEQCPFLPGDFKREDWSMPDPADSSISEANRIAAFRETRDKLVERIKKLI